MRMSAPMEKLDQKEVPAVAFSLRRERLEKKLRAMMRTWEDICQRKFVCRRGIDRLTCGLLLQWGFRCRVSQVLYRRLSKLLDARGESPALAVVVISRSHSVTNKGWLSLCRAHNVVDVDLRKPCANEESG